MLLINGGLALVAASGCHRNKVVSKHDTTGSGDRRNPPSQPWEVIREGEDAFVVARGSAVAVIDREGRLVSHPSIARERAENAAMDGRLLAWADGANNDVVHLFDLDTGREHWHVSAAHRVDLFIFGVKSIGLLTEEGIEVRHASDGALGFHATGPKVMGAAYRDGLFAFIDETGNITAVDETTDEKRWSFDTHGGYHGDYDAWFDGTAVAANGWRVNVETGQGHAAPKSPLDPARVTKVAAASGGGSLFADEFGAKERSMYFVAEHRIVWRSKEWARFLDTRLGRGAVAITTPDSGAVVLEYRSPSSRVLVGFDNKTGHVRFDRDLGERDALLGGDGDCLGLLEMTRGLKLTCLDASTGKAMWDHPLAGKVAQGWHVNRQFLVASGSPARIEAIDGKGETRWSITLPDTEVRDAAIGTGLVAHVDTSRESAWQLLDGLLVLPDVDAITILDLATGKLTVTKP
jgi:outer membrane protein assembly factor BamB